MGKENGLICFIEEVTCPYWNGMGERIGTLIRVLLDLERHNQDGIIKLIKTMAVLNQHSGFLIYFLSNHACKSVCTAI